MGACRIFLVLLFSLLLGACSEPQRESLPSGGTILAFGDSLTVGVGTSNSKAYPAVLEALSGYRVVSAGVSGETTEGGLQRLPRVLDRHSPDLLILLEGGNDILRSRPYAGIEQNLRAMIDLAQARGVPVVLIGVPEKKLFSSSAPFYARIAEDYGLVYEGALIGELQRSPELKSDHVHFNEQGYRILAESVHKLLQDHGYLP